jgi:hypothetical protein
MAPTRIVSTISTVDAFETTSWEFDGTTRTNMPITFEGRDFTIEDAATRHSEVVIRMYRED